MNSKGRHKKNKVIHPPQKKATTKTDTKKISGWVWFALGAVIITTFGIYYNAIKFNILYSWDDHLYIRDNADITGLSWANIKSFFTSFYAGNYQPAAMLFYALDYKIGASQAWVFHFNNILLHILNTVLVFVFVRKISADNALVALTTAAFFAVHPLHVESVAWVSERKDVLYSFFFLLSLIMYSNYLKKQKIKQLIYTGTFFILSCLSKSAAVVLPLVMLLLDFYFNRKFSRKTIAEKVPFFLISLTFGIVAIYSQKDSSAIQNMAPSMSALEHVSVVSFSFMTYLLKSVIPIKLSAIYPYPMELGSMLPLIYYVSILFVGIFLFLLFYSLKWGKDVAFGFLFFIATIILVLQIIPVGANSMADRYTYVPYIGIFFIIGKIFERLFLFANKKINYKQYSLILLFLGFIAFSIITYGQVKKWENEETIFSNVISNYPKCKDAYRARGMFFMEYHANYGNSNINREDDLKKAISDFTNSLKFALKQKDKWQAYYDLGEAKMKLGDYIGAIQEYDNSIKIDSSLPQSYINRGTCYVTYYVKTVYANDTSNRIIYLKKAIEDFEKALNCEIGIVDIAKAYCNLGDAKVRLGDFAGAINDFDNGIQTNSIIAGSFAYSFRGLAKLQLKNYEGALTDYNKAIELNPQDAGAVQNRDYIISILGSSKK